ncbi:MAG: aldehyde dehydrogenase family protein [Bacteroidales bacterium]
MQAHLLRHYFSSGASLEPENRIKTLQAVQKAVQIHLPRLYDALQEDLHKSKQESYLTEIAFVLSEIDYHIKHVKKWSKPQHKRSSVILFPSKSRILYQPYGVVLIIAPWNYPFRLLFAPMIAAIAAGNCVLLKPSHLALHTADICVEIIKTAMQIIHKQPAYIPISENQVPATWGTKQNLPASPIEIMTGGPKVMENLLQEKYDYIFYTGGPGFGKTIAGKAAEDLTPVTLELGGKSPCIITATSNLKLAAKRVAWGKFLNCGQTCVAPDYLLIESTVKNDFLCFLKSAIHTLYDSPINKSPFYGRIIALPAFNRLKAMIGANPNTILYGGATNEQTLFIEPTILDAGTLSNIEKINTVPAMQEEIFGPILPVIEYTNLKDAVHFINSRPKPLALYLFADKPTANQILKNTFSGGACVNDTIMHIATNNLPFGGVGLSGMGNYHGKYGFETFSHKKSYVVSLRNFDLPLKYPPYKWFERIKRFL